MWFTVKDSFIELRIIAKPKAKKSALIRADDHALHIALQAIPKEGEANKELIDYLSKLINIPKSHIIFIRGDSCRYKTVRVPLTTKMQSFIDNLK